MIALMAVVAAIVTGGDGAEDTSVTSVTVAPETATAVGSGRFWHPSKSLIGFTWDRYRAPVAVYVIKRSCLGGNSFSFH